MENYRALSAVLSKTLERAASKQIDSYFSHDISQHTGRATYSTETTLVSSVLLSSVWCTPVNTQFCRCCTCHRLLTRSTMTSFWCVCPARWECVVTLWAARPHAVSNWINWCGVARWVGGWLAGWLVSNAFLSRDISIWEVAQLYHFSILWEPLCSAIRYWAVSSGVARTTLRASVTPAGYDLFPLLCHSWGSWLLVLLLLLLGAQESWVSPSKS